MNSIFVQDTFPFTVIRLVTFPHLGPSLNHYTILQTLPLNWLWAWSPKTGALLLRSVSSFASELSPWTLISSGNLTLDLPVKICKLVFCYWGKSESLRVKPPSKHILRTLICHQLTAMHFSLEWLRRHICFSSDLSDKSCFPADIEWLCSASSLFPGGFTLQILTGKWRIPTNLNNAEDIQTSAGFCCCCYWQVIHDFPIEKKYQWQSQSFSWDNLVLWHVSGVWVLQYWF